MRYINKNSKAKRVIAVLWAVVLVITSIGAMPQVFASEVTETIIVPLIDFNDYETANLGVMDSGSSKHAYITAWSGAEPRFQVQNDSGKVGTVTANISAKDGVASDKYFDKNVLVYEEFLLPAMPFSVDDTPMIDTNPETGGTTEEGALKTNGLALNYQNDLVNTGMSKIALTQGEQLVYEVSVHSDKYFAMYDRRNAKGSDNTTNILNHLFWVEGGKLYVNDGTKTSFDKSKALGSVVLPGGRWVDLKFVYTAGDGVHKNGSDDTLRVYVDGKITALDGADKKGVNTLASDFLGATNQRFTIEGKSSFDNFKVTRYSGMKYTDETVPIPEVIEVVPTISFNGWPADKTQPAKGGTVFDTTFESDLAVKNTKIYVGNTTVNPAVANYVGDTTANVAGKGKTSGDAYFKGTENVQYRSSDNGGVLNKDTGLSEGDQMVVSFQTRTDYNFTIYTRYEGKRWVSTDNTKNGKPTGAPATVELNNFNKMLTILGATLNIANAEASSGSYKVGDTSYTIYDDAIDEANVASIKLPASQWVTVTLVYTAGAQTVSLGSESSAEVVSVETDKEDTVEVYINNIKVLDKTALSENSLFRRIDRFDFQSSGVFDNFGVKLYRYGAKFDANTIAGADVDEATDAGWYGPKIYVDDTETATAVKGNVKSLDAVSDCVLITASGAEVDGDALAKTAAHAVVKGKDGKTYTAQIIAADSLASAFTPTTYSGAEKMDKRDRDNGSTSRMEDSTDFARFGKAAGEKAYTWTPYMSGSTWIWQRTWIDSEVNAGTTPTAAELFNAVPIYISFDILYDDTVTDLSKGNMLILSGAAVTRNSQTGALTRSGGTNFIVATISDGLRMDVNKGSSTGVETAFTGNKKQWHNVTMQLWPYTDKYEFYVDGNLEYNGQFFGDFIGINNLYFNVIQNGFWLDNFVVTGGIYKPIPKAEVNLTVGDTSSWAAGLAWNAEGKFIEKNKSQNGIPYDDAIANSFSAEDAEVMFINASGEVVTSSTENGIFEQIVVRGSDGRYTYYGIKPRTGLRRINATPDGAEDQTWLIDIADGYGEQYEDFIVYVARYSDDNRLLVRCDPYEVTEANVDGDTWFIDVPADKAIENGDKVFVWSTDGKITPIYKE